MVPMVGPSIFAGGTFVVTPSPWLVLLCFCWLVLGSVTAAKGHWLWLLIGVPLGGVIWPVSALMPAARRSLWTAAARRLRPSPQY